MGSGFTECSATWSAESMRRRGVWSRVTVHEQVLVYICPCTPSLVHMTD
jgi:hypothetical protein